MHLPRQEKRKPLGRFEGVLMARKLLVSSAWVLGTATAIPLLLGLYVGTFISPGLGGTDSAEISAALGIVLLTLAASIYVGFLGSRGRLPGTAHRGAVADNPSGGPRFLARLFAFLGILVASSAVAAIVAATVVTDYVPEVFQRQFHAGEIDWIITVESEVLRETRDLRVKLPDEYDAHPDRRYPVLLVLDGEWQLDHTDESSKTLRWLDLGDPMIVVGVVNGVAGRSVDFLPPEYGTGPARADRFLEFLETEALPAIDRELRTTTDRVLSGYSLGGLFAIYTLVQRPDLFVGRFALSPSLWRGDQAMISDLEQFLAENPNLDSFLYTSLGSEETATMRGGFNALVAALERSAPPGLKWQSRLVEESSHDNNSWRSTPSALEGFWEFWRETHGAPIEGTASGG